MGILGDALVGLRKLLSLEQRVESLNGEMERLSAAHTDTRERLIRLEVIIEEARRTGAGRRASQRHIES
jgi:hypothetical protein